MEMFANALASAALAVRGKTANKPNTITTASRVDMSFLKWYS